MPGATNSDTASQPSTKPGKGKRRRPDRAEEEEKSWSKGAPDSCSDARPTYAGDASDGGSVGGASDSSAAAPVRRRDDPEAERRRAPAPKRLRRTVEAEEGDKQQRAEKGKSKGKLKAAQQGKAEGADPRASSVEVIERLPLAARTAILAPASHADDRDRGNPGGDARVEESKKGKQTRPGPGVSSSEAAPGRRLSHESEDEEGNSAAGAPGDEYGKARKRLLSKASDRPYKKSLRRRDDAAKDHRGYKSRLFQGRTLGPGTIPKKAASSSGGGSGMTIPKKSR